MANNTTFLSQGVFYQPDQTNVEKNEDWYKSNNLFGLSRYNPLMPTFYPKLADNNNKDYNVFRWANKNYRALSYYMGQQLNDNYLYMNTAENNEPLPVPFINNQVIYQLVRRVTEILVESRVKPMLDVVHAKGLSREVLESKKSKINIQKWIIDMKTVMSEETLKELGLYFEPLHEIEIEDDEMLEKAQETMQEAIEIMFTAIVKDVLLRNNYETLFKKLTDYLVITYFSRVEVYVENRQIKIKIHRADRCIFDNGEDDEQGMKQRFQGVIEIKTIPQLVADKSYNWTPGEIEELQSIAKYYNGIIGQGMLPGWFMNMQNSIYDTGLLWWNNINSVPKVLCSRQYWKGVDENDKQVLYTSELVGGRFMKKWGPAPNQTEKFPNKADVDNYFIDYLPDMIYGFNVSLIDRLADISDWIDALESKKKTLFARAKGRAIAVIAENLPPGVSVASIASDVSLMGITVLPLKRTDDLPGQDAGKRFIQPLDFTMDVSAIQEIYNEIEYQKAEMKRIASIPDSLLGQQKDADSNKALETTINQGLSGLGSFRDGYTEHLNRICQRIADLAKLTYPMSEEQRELLLSPSQVEYLTFTEDMTLTDIGVYIDQDNIYDDEEMAKIDRYAELQAANSGGQGWFDIADLTELSLKRTKTEKANFLAYKKKRFQMMQAIEAEKQRQAAMQQNVNNNTAILAGKVLDNKGQEQRQQAEIEADLTKQVLTEQAPPQS